MPRHGSLETEGRQSRPTPGMLCAPQPLRSGRWHPAAGPGAPQDIIPAASFGPVTGESLQQSLSARRTSSCGPRTGVHLNASAAAFSWESHPRPPLANRQTVALASVTQSRQGRLPGVPPGPEAQPRVHCSGLQGLCLPVCECPLFSPQGLFSERSEQ